MMGLTRETMAKIMLGQSLNLDDFIQVVRFNKKVYFSDDYIERVKASRLALEQLIQDGKIMYGINTGFGSLCDQLISSDQTTQLQKNLLRSHAVSIGEPLNKEQARACMLMILQNLGQGYSGIRIEVLHLIKDFLNADIYPFIPQEGSVGYLALEAHFALTLIGEGKIKYEGEWKPAQSILKKYQLEPISLLEKEGLSLISGTTSTTALASIALYDLKNLIKSVDIIAAMSFESLSGILSAYDADVMNIRPHTDQSKVAHNILNILKDSQLALPKPSGLKLQDALSLRCIPQLHGSCRHLIEHAIKTIEQEINSCCDNPVIIRKNGIPEVISACNADSSYVGMAMDSIAIAIMGLAKMSERRNARLLDMRSSGVPDFLVKQPGLHSGLMIPQYTQAGLLNDMRALAYPATIDNTPTCNGQEDYVAMGYNASKKALSLVAKAQHILAIELLSNVYFNQFIQDLNLRSTATLNISQHIQNMIQDTDQDTYIYEYIVDIKNLISSELLINIVENHTGQLM